MELGPLVWPFLEMSLDHAISSHETQGCLFPAEMCPPRLVRWFLGWVYSTWHPSPPPYTSSVSICLPSGRDRGEDYASRCTGSRLKLRKKQSVLTEAAELETSSGLLF